MNKFTVRCVVIRKKKMMIMLQLFFYNLLRLPDVIERNRLCFSAAEMTSRVVVTATLADGVMTSLGVRVKRTDCDQVRS